MQELSNIIASKYEEIIDSIKSFSNEYLNEEYRDICITAAETLISNNDEQLKKGKSVSWAAGIVHAIGSINDLFDSKKEPYIKALDLYKAFGVSSSTGSSKSKEVRNLLDLSKENKQWILDVSKDANSAKEEVAATVKNVGKLDEKPKVSNTDKLKISKNLLIAQKIVDYAWKQKNYKTRAKLAKEALEVYENCADAYIILSKDSSLNNNQKRELLEKAVKAGGDALSIDNLETVRKELFKFKIAQPFLGAKYTLAVHLWDTGERDLAIEHAFEILKCNKEDNLMIRGLLANWLLSEENYDKLKDLLDEYNNDYLAAINYSKVVLLYKTNNIKEAENALRRAYKRNPFVIPYILRQKKISHSVQYNIKFGGEEEAIQYASISLKVWNDDKLLAWIKQMKKDFDILNFK